jgi:hypothetical protein
MDQARIGKVITSIRATKPGSTPGIDEFHLPELGLRYIVGFVLQPEQIQEKKKNFVIFIQLNKATQNG